jgi:hypothetical protein
MSGRWQPLQNLSVGTECSQGFPFSFTTDVFAHGEGGQLKWLTETSTWKYTINVAPARWWSISSDVRISNVSPVSVEVPLSLPSGYLATCEGLWRQGILRCEIGLYGTAPVTGEYREASADLRLSGFSNGRRFAHFGKVMFSLHLWSVQWARDSLQIKLQSGSAQGDLAGTVESWPFTSGLAQFLGDRRHLVGTGSLSWKSIDLSDRFHIGKPLWLLIGLKYLYLEPDVRYVSWRPLAFGFGVDDLQSGRLEIRDAHLIRLELGPNISFQRWLVKLNVGQWIPILMRKELSPSDSSNSDFKDSDLTDRSDKPYRHNGLSFSASLSLAL